MTRRYVLYEGDVCGWRREQADREGWSLGRETMAREVVRITITSDARFATDTRALAYVADKAAKGSAYHQQALSLCGIERKAWNAAGDLIKHTWTDLNGATTNRLPTDDHAYAEERNEEERG
jgi:hypothetical protein